MSTTDLSLEPRNTTTHGRIANAIAKVTTFPKSDIVMLHVIDGKKDMYISLPKFKRLYENQGSPQILQEQVTKGKKRKDFKVGQIVKEGIKVIFGNSGRYARESKLSDVSPDDIHIFYVSSERIKALYELAKDDIESELQYKEYRIEMGMSLTDPTDWQ
ncbi:MAG: hypothetical protein HQK91_03260 [Nitrospirae bacterium]|nr:hypothetical protein [Nitrospirota bacterium]